MGGTIPACRKARLKATSKYSRFQAHKKTHGFCGVTYLQHRVPRVAGNCWRRQDIRGLLRILAARRKTSFLMTIAIILLLGLAVGVLVGLLGIGGGIVLVPAMVYFLRMDQHLAQGTSLFILLPPIGFGALREYWREGHVDLRVGILCALGMLLGGYGGSLMALPISSRTLKAGFGCFLMLSAILLWEKSRPQASAEQPSEGTERA